MQFIQVEQVKREHPRNTRACRAPPADMLKTEEPFDAVHVGAAAEEIPSILVDKLSPGECTCTCRHITVLVL